MILPVSSNLQGCPLSEEDLRKLEAAGISRDLAKQALLRRVTSSEGAAIVGRPTTGAYSGMVFPYILPGESHVREYRLRRDRPEMEYGADGRSRKRTSTSLLRDAETGFTSFPALSRNGLTMQRSRRQSLKARRRRSLCMGSPGMGSMVTRSDRGFCQSAFRVSGTGGEQLAKLLALTAIEGT
jgi:hypothetical protein